MGLHQIRKHTVDILFPLAVFFAFAATAVMAILLSANLYSKAVEGSDRMYNGATALSYLEEKLHQNDAQGAVSLREIQGTPVLVLDHSVRDPGCCTYIYVWDGTVRELFARQELPFDPAAGKPLLQAQSLSCQWLAGGVLEIAYTDPKGIVQTSCVGLMAGEG